MSKATINLDADSTIKAVKRLEDAIKAGALVENLTGLGLLYHVLADDLGLVVDEPVAVVKQKPTFAPNTRVLVQGFNSDENGEGVIVARATNKDHWRVRMATGNCAGRTLSFREKSLTLLENKSRKRYNDFSSGDVVRFKSGGSSGWSAWLEYLLTDTGYVEINPSTGKRRSSTQDDYYINKYFTAAACELVRTEEV